MVQEEHHDISLCLLFQALAQVFVLVTFLLADFTFVVDRDFVEEKVGGPEADDVADQIGVLRPDFLEGYVVGSPDVCKFLHLFEGGLGVVDGEFGLGVAHDVGAGVIGFRGVRVLGVGVFGVGVFGGGVRVLVGV